jgi:adenylate kinase
MGPPGAGKGTQAKQIASEFGIPEISTGAIFRSNVANGTELGQIVSAIMAKGELVPDEVTVGLVTNRLAEPDAAEGFLLDGFPRTIPQAEALCELLDGSNLCIDAVISLVVDAEAVVQRMLKRAELEGRDDDNEETIRRRFEVYYAETEPLMAFFREHGRVVEVDGMGEIAEVTARILAALESEAGV